MYKKEKNLCVFRTELDNLDDVIMALLEKRFAIVSQVAEYKKFKNLPPVDSNREEQIIGKAKSKEVAEVYKCLLQISHNKVKKECCD